MKKIIIIILIFSGIYLYGKNTAIVGKKVPKFVLETHDEIKINPKTFKGKYYCFIFEGQGGEHKNIHVRKRIESFIRMLSADKRKKITFFTVADVSKYLSFIRGIIRSKVRSNEKEHKVRIYCDFTGHILNRFKLINKFTNFVLVDDKGIARFIIRGIVKHSELRNIITYLIKKFNADYVRAPIDISAAYNSAAYNLERIQK